MRTPLRTLGPALVGLLLATLPARAEEFRWPAGSPDVDNGGYPVYPSADPRYGVMFDFTGCGNYTTHGSYGDNYGAHANVVAAREGRVASVTGATPDGGSGIRDTIVVRHEAGYETDYAWSMPLSVGSSGILEPKVGDAVSPSKVLTRPNLSCGDTSASAQVVLYFTIRRYGAKKIVPVPAGGSTVTLNTPIPYKYPGLKPPMTAAVQPGSGTPRALALTVLDAAEPAAKARNLTTSFAVSVHKNLSFLESLAFWNDSTVHGFARAATNVKYDGWRWSFELDATGSWPLSHGAHYDIAVTMLRSDSSGKVVEKDERTLEGFRAP